ncbi:MAG: hypothetical protein QGI34_16595 [Candidatus Latescibacteria bacterium]|nr:hypothetical protein [Candidatus Latescibacterota bacterium]
MTDIRQRLPIIASRIIGSYDEPGGCNHPDGLNLPSSEHVSRFFRIYSGSVSRENSKPILKQNATFFVDTTVNGVYIRLRDEIEKRVRCRQIAAEAPRPAGSSKLPVSEHRRRLSLITLRRRLS